MMKVYVDEMSSMQSIVLIESATYLLKMNLLVIKTVAISLYNIMNGIVDCSSHEI